MQKKLAQKKMSQQGFTLIEIMIVVVIVGVLASIAYPNYTKYVQKGNRVEAQADLLDAAQRLQKCFTTNGTYKAVAGTANCSVYTKIESTYKSNGKGFYELSFKAVDDASFTLLAKAKVSPQTGDTVCTEIELNHQGIKSPAACW